MVKIIDEGSFPPDHPIYKQGWSSYIGPRQNKPIEKPTSNTSPKSTKSSEAAEKQVAEPEKLEE
jgi:hypothetical protein